MIRQSYKVAKPKSLSYKLFDYQEVQNAMPSRTLPITKPSQFVNIECENGALKQEERVTMLKNASLEDYPVLDTLISRARYYSGVDGDKTLLVAHSTNDGAYCLDITKVLSGAPKNWEKLCPIPLECASEFRINGKNILVLASGEYMYTYDGAKLVEKIATERPPCSVYDMCNHFGRMFVVDSVDRYKILFSDEINPFNFRVSSSEGGYINVDIAYGKIIKLISMNEYLYIILERGIMRLRAYGEQEEFQLKKVDAFTGEIIAQSLAKCGNSIVFVSSSGINAFDGYSCRIIHEELRELMIERLDKNPTFVNAQYCDNCYYLSHIAKDGNKALKIYLDKNKYSFLSLGVYRGLATIAREGEEVILYCMNNLAREQNYPIAKLGDGEGKATSACVYASQNIDFLEPSKLKVIKSVVAPQGFRGELVIATKDERRRYDLSDKRQVNINMSGYSFDITLEIKDRKFLDFSPIVAVDTINRGEYE